MPQTPDLFSEDNNSKKKFAAERSSGFFGSLPPQEIGSEDDGAAAAIVISQPEGGSVRQFHLVGETSFFTLKRSGATGRKKESGFAGTNKNSFFNSASFAPLAKSSGAGQASPEATLELLLFYFDQIVYLREIADRMRQLEGAVADADIAGIKRLAAECADLSQNCGLTSAAASLKCLSQLKTRLQMTDAAFLLSQVRKELRSFRTALKENLTQLGNRLETGSFAA